jgi:hypothetical protein
MAKPLLRLILLTLIGACQATDERALVSLGSGAGPENRIATPAPVSSEISPSRLFSQPFELMNNLFVNFQGCTFTLTGAAAEDENVCRVSIEVTPAPVYAPCPYVYGGSDYFPDNNLCEDTSDDLSCAAEAVVYDNGIMSIRNAAGTGPACGDYDGYFYYEVTVCGTTTNQRLWRCGAAQTPYDLVWQQL